MMMMMMMMMMMIRQSDFKTNKNRLLHTYTNPHIYFLTLAERNITKVKHLQE